MLLRSSSSPRIQSFLSENPKKALSSLLRLTSFPCNSSPFSPSASSWSSQFNPKTNSLTHKPFRRAQSDNNLEGLPLNSSDKNKYSMLQSAPSFSIYTSEDGFDGEHEREDLERSVTIGERIGDVGSGEFSFRKKGMGLIEESGEEEGDGEAGLNGFQDLGIGGEVEPVSPPMYLATGTGIEGDSFGGGGDVEEYFKRMVGEDPSNPLFLRNYAQLLQSKGDLPGAEDYFFRATLADPKDGEICSLYAKLVWELHRDQDRALSYFEQAALAAPEDSHVLAAYASFLWEIEEEEEVDKGIAGIDVDSGKGGNLEDYYKRMVEKDPCNPLFLRNYAQFLSQSKGDLQGAEEYYSRAILADPADGEMISEYATLVWELHRDHDKTLSYFERAVQATPGDSHVLAAYAKFLWETDDNNEAEDSAGQ